MINVWQEAEKLFVQNFSTAGVLKNLHIAWQIVAGIVNKLSLASFEPRANTLCTSAFQYIYVPKYCAQWSIFLEISNIWGL